MNKKLWGWVVFAFLGLLVIWGLSPTRKAKQVLSHSIQASGTWKSWQNKHAVQFIQTLIFYDASGMVSDKEISVHRFPLHGTAKIRIESIGDPLRKLVQGYDGRHSWSLISGAVSQDPAELATAEFATLTSFYWFGLPFKLRDRGVILRYQGKTPSDESGRSFNKVRVTYHPGIGASPNDWYLYYFDSKTGLIAKVLFEITAGPFSGRIEMGEWLDYQDFDGIQIATRRIFYPADVKENILAGKALEELIEEIEFRPYFPGALFEAPKK